MLDESLHETAVTSTPDSRDSLTELHLNEAVRDLETLIVVANALIGTSPIPPAGLSQSDRASVPACPHLVERFRSDILLGLDPLGAAYCSILNPGERRGSGQTFTPPEVVVGMFNWAFEDRQIARIVDPGAGTGRFVLYGLQQLPCAVGVASEIDPVVAFLLRANACVLGLNDRLEIRIGDFRSLELEPILGKTLFVGNPPYVRHHGIGSEWKQWYSDSLKRRGYAASKLAGLHLHFFVKALELARPGDVGCFITAAEWLDSKYGQSMREMMTGALGGCSVFVVAPEVSVFGDAMVSACIACFEPWTDHLDLEFKVLNSLTEIHRLRGGHTSSKLAAMGVSRWSAILYSRPETCSDGFIRLGDLFKVSRGQVTGKNSVWVCRGNEFGLPSQFLVPAITDASDITTSGGAIDGKCALKHIVSLPSQLVGLPSGEADAIERFIAWAKSQGADKGWTAEHRSPWWSVDMTKSAPQIVVTYMGRRPPVFAFNVVGAKIINVAHGLYPKVPLKNSVVQKLIVWLNKNIRQESGRVYAGGLTKFEPSEIAALWIPDPRIPSNAHYE